MILHQFVVSVCVVFSTFASEINVSNTRVWGPGLRGEANLPVRYFHIEAFDDENKPILEDLGHDAFEMELSTPAGTDVRSRSSILNLGNGSYIARYIIHDYTGKLNISLTHKGQTVSGFPLTMEGVRGNDCNCPISQKQWMESVSCPNFRQIHDDLKAHKVIDLSNLYERMEGRFGKYYSVCNYVVLSNQVYRKCFGKNVGFRKFMDAVLLSLVGKVQLPDISFFLNLGDYPAEISKRAPLPIVSWCGSNSSYDIVLPTYYITRSVLEMMKGVSMDVFTVQANAKPRWIAKKDMGFFRGRDSRRERLNLAALSLNRSDILDAGITRYFFFPRDDEKYGQPTQLVPFYDFFKYKYQLNVDGTVAAYRFPYLMLGNSAVFKQDSEYYEHFYKEMKPNKHYIPLKHDLSDVIEKLEWARANDEQVRRIQEAGTKLARKILTPANVLCYHVALFEAYARRQSGEVKILEGMEKLEQPFRETCKCEIAAENMVKDEL